MNVQNYSEFLRMQDYYVIETKSCCLYTKASRFFFQNFPFHRGITLSEEDTYEFFTKSRSVAGRYLSEGEVSELDKSVWICDNKDYDLKDLHKTARTKTRRGLERCKVERVDFDWLTDKAMPLIKDTLVRQNRPENSVTESTWKKLCFAAKQNPDFEAWASFADGELASFTILGIVDSYTYLWERYSTTKHLKYFYPNNVLTFLVIKEMLSSRHLRGVITGVESFGELKGLDEYKVRMGYRRKYLRQKIMLNPMAIPFVNKFTIKIINNIASNSNNDCLRKLMGFIRSYQIQIQT